MARKAFDKTMDDSDFEVRIWDESPRVAYVRPKDTFIFAKVHEKPDPVRYVIHVGGRYIGYCTSLEPAIERAKALVAAQLKCNYTARPPGLGGTTADKRSGAKAPAAYEGKGAHHGKDEERMR